MNISLQKYFGYPIAYISKNVHISGKKHPKTGYFSILTTMTKCVVNKFEHTRVSALQMIY